jgi:membrane-bound lytic murein transglycosylase D
MGKVGSLSLQLLPLVLLLLYVVYNERKETPPPPSLPMVEATISIPSAPNNEGLTEASMSIPFLNARSFDLPDEVRFANEVIPMNIWDVRERFDRELHINIYWHNNTIFLLKRANRWLPLMEPILAKYGIPDDFKYLAVIESDLMNKVSPAKAVGFWQILEGTAKELGLEVSRDVDERYDPIKSTEAACLYLKKAYEKFGNWTTVAASYNRGIAGMQNAMKDQREADYMKLMLNEETSRYLFRIVACKEILQNPDKYGFHVHESHLYHSVPYKEVAVDNDIDDLVTFARKFGTDYKTLKLLNPWLRNDKLNVRRGKVYTIKLPA